MSGSSSDESEPDYSDSEESDGHEHEEEDDSDPDYSDSEESEGHEHEEEDDSDPDYSDSEESEGHEHEEEDLVVINELIREFANIALMANRVGASLKRMKTLVPEALPRTKDRARMYRLFLEIVDTEWNSENKEAIILDIEEAITTAKEQLRRDVKK